MNGRRAGWMVGILLFSGLLTSCGQPGAPQPPSLEVPRAVENFSAVRKGDRVTLRWTPPTRFTDGRTIRRIGPTRICRAPGRAPAIHCNIATTIPSPVHATSELASREQLQYDDVLSQGLIQGSADASVMYGVEVLNTYGRSVGLSNQVPISTAPSLGAPENFSAEVTDQGVDLHWQPVAAPSIPGIVFVYQIARRAKDADFLSVATVPIEQSGYVDQTMQWESNYEYRVAVLTEETAGNHVLVEGEDSPAVSVFAHDTFPPAQPRELQAVFSGPGQQPFIDLSWAPNLEPDLAGYNIYRREEGGALAKVNAQVVTSPSYRDSGVEPGKTYFYAVSAVDQRGNESPKSPETSESVPQ